MRHDAPSQEQILRRLLDESTDGLVALNDHGTIVAANECTARLFGRRREFLLGKPFASLLPVPERRAFRRAFGSAVAGKAIDVEVVLSPQAAAVKVSLRAASSSVTPHVVVRLSSDERAPLAPPHETRHELERILRRFPHGVVGLRNDLTVVFANPNARRLLDLSAGAIGRPLPVDGELHALAERALRLKVPLRPTELLHGESTLRVTVVPGHDPDPAILLIEDVTGAHAKERVTSEFLRNASHQLRTPLTAITAAIDVLQSGAKDDAQERDRFLEHIEQHVARMTRLTRGLLVLSRAQSGEQPLRLDFVELEPLLMRLAAQAAPREGVHIETLCTPGLAALGQPDLIEETLAALVDNAVAYTDRGTIRLSAIRAQWSALIEIADSGIGILPEHRERIFEPFYRPWQGEGFGLGLAIARQAVEAMDGRIEIDGMPGTGTRVLIRLPSARVLS